MTSPATEAGKQLAFLGYPDLGAAIEREARAAVLAELRAGVDDLHEEEWRDCVGNCHMATVARVLDLIAAAEEQG